MATRGGLAAAALVVLAGALGSAGVAAEIGGVGRAHQPPLVCAGTPDRDAAGCTARLVADLPTVPTVDPIDPSAPASVADREATDRVETSDPVCSGGPRGVRCTESADDLERSRD